MITKATYLRPIERFGCHLGETPIEIAAECFQDGGENTASELLIVWTDETMARLAALDMTGDELVGCTEAMEEAWFQAEEAACRVASVRQRSGERAA